MNPAAASQSHMIGLIAPLIVIAIVLPFRLRRMMRERPLKPNRLWIVPGIFLLLTGVQLYFQPPHGLGWLYCGAALVVGAMLGWQRGRLTHITVDPSTGTLLQKGSIAAMIFLLVVILLRTGLREVADLHIGGFNLDVNLVAVVLIVFALGLFSVQRIEMYLRAKQLLDAARPA